MTYEAILKELKSKIYSPVYFLYGDEPYFIDQVSDYIENHVLDENEREFNQSILYGKDTDLANVIGHAKRFPMMSNHQVVVIREAQDLKGLIPKKGTGESSGKDKESLSDLLIAYVNKPQASTILVFCCKYKNLDKRSKLYKALEKNGVVFQSEFLYENKIPDWIEKYLKTKNSKINSRAALLLTEYLGTNLGKISNELDKLLLNIQAGEEITSEHIEKYIGISKDYNVFELQEALGKKNLQKSFRIVKYMGLNPKAHPFPMTIGNLYGFFAKILRYHTLNDRSRASVAESLGVPPFFVTDYENAARNYPLPAVIDVVSILHEFDLKTKGIESASTDDGELLQEMVSRIIMN